MSKYYSNIRSSGVADLAAAFTGAYGIESKVQLARQEADRNYELALRQDARDQISLNDALRVSADNLRTAQVNRDLVKQQTDTSERQGRVFDQQLITEGVNTDTARLNLGVAELQLDAAQQQNVIDTANGVQNKLMMLNVTDPDYNGGGNGRSYLNNETIATTLNAIIEPDNIEGQVQKKNVKAGLLMLFNQMASVSKENRWTDMDQVVVVRDANGEEVFSGLYGQPETDKALLSFQKQAGVTIGTEYTISGQNEAGEKIYLTDQGGSSAQEDITSMPLEDLLVHANALGATKIWANTGVSGAMYKRAQQMANNPNPVVARQGQQALKAMTESQDLHNNVEGIITSMQDAGKNEFAREIEITAQLAHHDPSREGQLRESVNIALDSKEDEIAIEQSVQFAGDETGRFDRPISELAREYKAAKAPDADTSPEDLVNTTLSFANAVAKNAPDSPFTVDYMNASELARDSATDLVQNIRQQIEDGTFVAPEGAFTVAVDAVGGTGRMPKQVLGEKTYKNPLEAYDQSTKMMERFMQKHGSFSDMPKAIQEKYLQANNVRQQSTNALANAFAEQFPEDALSTAYAGALENRDKTATILNSTAYLEGITDPSQLLARIQNGDLTFNDGELFAYREYLNAKEVKELSDFQILTTKEQQMGLASLLFATNGDDEAQKEIIAKIESLDATGFTEGQATTAAQKAAREASTAAASLSATQERIAQEKGIREIESLDLDNIAKQIENKKNAIEVKTEEVNFDTKAAAENVKNLDIIAESANQRDEQIFEDLGIDIPVAVKSLNNARSALFGVNGEIVEEGLFGKNRAARNAKTAARNAFNEINLAIDNSTSEDRKQTLNGQMLTFATELVGALAIKQEQDYGTLILNGDNFDALGNILGGAVKLVPFDWAQRLGQGIADQGIKDAVLEPSPNNTGVLLNPIWDGNRVTGFAIMDPSNPEIQYQDSTVSVEDLVDYIPRSALQRIANQSMKARHAGGYAVQMSNSFKQELANQAAQ